VSLCPRVRIDREFPFSGEFNIHVTLCHVHIRLQVVVLRKWLTFYVTDAMFRV
jgi:hypothetical protein